MGKFSGMKIEPHQQSDCADFCDLGRGQGPQLPDEVSALLHRVGGKLFFSDHVERGKSGGA